jgi:hypothetical protein
MESPGFCIGGACETSLRYEMFARLSRANDPSPDEQIAELTDNYGLSTEDAQSLIRLDDGKRLDFFTTIVSEAYQNLWSSPPENELPTYLPAYQESATPSASNAATDEATGRLTGSSGTSLQGGGYPNGLRIPGFVAPPPGPVVHEQEDVEARMANFEHLFSGPIDFGPMLENDSLMLAGNGNGNNMFDFSWSLNRFTD